MLYETLYAGTQTMRDYNRSAQTDSISNLPNVKDPEATFAGITRQDYMSYVDNFRGFEEKLLGLTDDDSLRQRAVEDQKKQMSMLEDFWLPRREGGRGTEINTLPSGQNLGEIEDIEYFRKKLYQALNVPISRIEGT